MTPATYGLQTAIGSFVPYSLHDMMLVQHISSVLLLLCLLYTFANSKLPVVPSLPTSHDALLLTCMLELLVKNMSLYNRRSSESTDYKSAVASEATIWLPKGKL